MQLPSNKTKIICTIGPASESQPILERMIQNGMAVARVNLSHGDLDNHARTIAAIRAAAASVGQPVAIWGDLPGSKLRLGRLAGGQVELARGQHFRLRSDEVLGDASQATLSLPDLARQLKPGDTVYLADGALQLRVNKVGQRKVLCEVVAGGRLRSLDGVNLPGVHLDLPSFGDRDRRRLAFAASQKLDAISPSFIQGAGDLVAVRQAAADLGYHPLLLAKIERAPAVQNLDAILEACDAVVVARGDLGLETPIEEIALLQKRIIRQANQAGKPAITATHMLESMVQRSMPTRAEAADVTNAVLDGAGCLTLSAETALGDHPAEVVAMMARIAAAAEPYIEGRLVGAGLGETFTLRLPGGEELAAPDLPKAIEQHGLQILAIHIHTATGSTARHLSRMRLPAWVVAFSSSQPTCQALQFCYGVYPIHLPTDTDPDQVALDWLSQIKRAAVLYRTNPQTGHRTVPRTDGPSQDRRS